MQDPDAGVSFSCTTFPASTALFFQEIDTVHLNSSYSHLSAVKALRNRGIRLYLKKETVAESFR